MLEKSPLMDRCRSLGFSPGLCDPAAVDDVPLAAGTVVFVLDDASVDTCPNRFLRLSIVLRCVCVCELLVDLKLIDVPLSNSKFLLTDDNLFFIALT